MADDELQSTDDQVSGTDGPAADAPVKKTAARKTAAKKAGATKKAPAKRTTKKAAAVEPSGEVAAEAPAEAAAEAEAEAEAKPARKTAAKKTTAKKAAAKKTTTKKAAAKKTAEPGSVPDEPAADKTATPDAEPAPSGTMPLFQVPETGEKPARKRAAAKKAPAKRSTVRSRAAEAAAAEALAAESAAEELEEPTEEPIDETAVDAAPEVAVESVEAAEVAATEEPGPDPVGEADPTAGTDESEESDDSAGDEGEGDDTGPRRRRRRGGRRRRRGGDGGSDADGDGGNDGGNDGGSDGAEADAPADRGGRGGRGGRSAAKAETPTDQGETTGDAADHDGDPSSDGGADKNGDEKSDGTEGSEGGTGTRRRRKRRREGDSGDGGGDDPSHTTTRVRRTRSPEDEITSIAGSTRLEAKKQRRRDGREAGRRRAPIVSEAEFLARRESVERVMVVRQRDELTQIGVVEDKVLVEHYVARESQTSLIGNVYLGRVQNVLPSMEAAFIDIGKGRNAVLYAGEVNWSQLGHKDGNPRKIESVLSSGQTILVQVSKDPIGNKGARLTSQISLAGRFLVYVPDGTTSGISRKLPDTERNRLKTLLKEVVPSTAGVIVRTAAEGASEEELTQDVERLKSRWEEIESKAKGKGGNPQLLHGEPDLTLKVVRDLFTEDFAKLVIQGDDAWDLVRGYVRDVAPDLEDRLEKYDAPDHHDVDLFSAYRIDEQIAKALDRKVFLPSGGSLVIDRTEAMTVVDVNTGKFTGSGGNLEETVTKNNLEAAEEVVRQLRLRDIGGIIVVDFIDMVLEANRDLVLRRMVECLGRDRTRHQVAEVTSLGLVQMTRKRIGTGLLESFSENCEHCQGRGVVIHDAPIEPRRGQDERGGNAGSGNGGGGTGGGSGGGNGGGGNAADGERRSGRRRGGRGRTGDDAQVAPATPTAPAAHKPTPAEFAAMASAEQLKDDVEPGTPAETPDVETPAVETLATEPAAPKVVTRTRRGVSRTVAPTTETEAEITVEAPSPVSEQPGQPEVAAEAPAEPAAPKVVTRSRRGVSRTVTPAPEAAETPETLEAAAVTDAPVPEPAAAAEASEEAPAEPAAPKVVTRSRRGVTRTVASTTAVTAVTAVQPPEPVAAEEAPVAPEPPQVVTRTRGRSASRVAVPPADETTSVPAPEPADDDTTEPAEDTGLHVPVKRKGRKR